MVGLVWFGRFGLVWFGRFGFGRFGLVGFFFIFISTPEGHERGTFWRIIISFQSGTENID